MFCGKCGLELNNANAACPRCGWHLPTNIKKPEKQITPPRDNFDYDEPSRQDFRRDEYYPPVPEEFRLPSQKGARPAAPPQKKKSSKKPIIIISIIIGVVLAVAVGVFFFFLNNNDSDERKLRDSEKELLAGNYAEGESLISDINTPQANAMRDFAKILRLKDNFAKVFKSDELRSEDSSVKQAGDELTATFRSFKSYNDLPNGLKEMYDSIAGKMDDRESALAALNKDDLKNAQYCVLEFKLRKEGKHFTIPDLEDIIAVSEPAVKSLEEKFINTDAYKKFSGGSKSLAAKDMNTFFTTVSTQVSQDKFDLEDYKKTKKRDDSLWFQNITRRYDAKVGDGLKDLNSESDMEENAETLYNALPYAWLAYAFDIE